MSKLKIVSAAFGATLALSAVGSAFAVPAEKVTICHATASATNPYVEITISGNAAKSPHLSDPGHNKPSGNPDYVKIPGEPCGGVVGPS